MTMTSNIQTLARDISTAGNGSDTVVMVRFDGADEFSLPGAQPAPLACSSRASYRSYTVRSDVAVGALVRASRTILKEWYVESVEVTFGLVTETGVEWLDGTVTVLEGLTD